MAVSESRLIKRYWEFCEKDEIGRIPKNTRGIYVLFEKCPRNKFDVVYIGMSGGEKTGIRGRLGKHRSRKRVWTHFSVLEVWDNIREEEVMELEGILRHIYRKDSHANRLGIQKSFKKLSKIGRKTQKEGWLK